MTPPAKPISPASIINSRLISVRDAPNALRIPTSRVRSYTAITMVLAIPMEATNRATLAIKPSRNVMATTMRFEMDPGIRTGG